MATGLRIAPELTLPIDLVTEPIGILANRGRGKSYTTHVLVEEIHDAGVPVVVLDVKGDWWGLRSSADGKSDGLPFYIFGGDHADLPLEPTAGQLLADLVVDERVSVVLDLSLVSKTKARSFTTAFAERLYHRNRDPLFVVVDEADVLIPQRATHETARLLGAMEDIAKRGRGRGIGMAVVTQRPQEVAKSVLDLMDTLILLGMTGPRSLKSVSEWISTHVDEDTPSSTVMSQLPSLPVGNAWVWSPMQQLLERVAVRRIRTYDSHVTPKPGQKRTTPRGRVDLDLEALGERITATVERAKADDPWLLRRRITELEESLRAWLQHECPESEARVEVVTLPVIPEETKAQLEAIYDRFSLAATEWAEQLASAVDQTDRIVDMSHSVRTLIRQACATAEDHKLPTEVKPGKPTQRSSAPPARSATSTTGRAPVAGSSTTGKRNPPSAREMRPAADGGPSKPQLKILNALAWFEAVSINAPTRGQVAFQARVSPKSSGFEKNCSTLRTRGLIEYPGSNRIGLTESGRLIAEWPERPGTSLELQQAFYDGVSKPQAAILQMLVDLYPADTDRQTLAESIGVSPVSSGFEKNLSTLRSLGLVDYPGRGLVAATDMLFIEA